MRQLALPVRLRAGSVFGSFYGGENEIAVRQLESLTTETRPIVVWLYGPPSVGKTHLLQAVCARAGAENRAAAYFPLREVDLNPDVLTGCDSLSFVCLDDFEAVAGHAGWERAVFRLYTLLEDQGGRLVVAADVPPAALAIELKDLASRLAAGMVLRLRALNDEEQGAALALRAQQLGLELPPEAVQYLLRRLPRDMATLCDALDRLDQASLASQRRLTVPFIRDVLERDPKLAG